jgi:hypothetical protein
MPAYVMARMVDTSVAPAAEAFATGVAVEPIRIGRTAKTSNKR